MSGYIGPIPVPQGIQNKESFTATAAQTTFNTNGYTDGAFISVYLNGVRLVNGTDYTATNGSDVVLASAANTGDVLDFETFNSFSLASQQFENITTKNPTHEDTDGGRESAISFQGEQSGGEISTLAQIQASHDGTADDQKGDLIFKTNDGSDNNAPTERLRIDSNGSIVTATLGASNTHLGEGAGAAIVSGGDNNTLIGKDAGAAISTGDNNVAVGRHALDENTTGERNVAIGTQALSTETQGRFSTAVGYSALEATNSTSAVDTYNVGLGYKAGEATSTGVKNTFVGGLAGLSNVGASNNTAVGFGSFYDNTTGTNNVSVGYESLTNNTTASRNTAVGYRSGYSATTGGLNTFVGYTAGYSNVSGTANVFVGDETGYNTTSSKNTFLGDDSGWQITSGAHNTILGRYNGNQGGLDIRTSDNNIVMSDGDGNPRIIVDPSGDVLIGVTSLNHLHDANAVQFKVGDYGQVYVTHATGTVNGIYYMAFSLGGSEIGSIKQANSTSINYNTTSDYRLKENVKDISDSITRVKQLQPKRFNFITEPDITCDGFLAHEVSAVVPSAVSGEKDEVQVWDAGEKRPDGVSVGDNKLDENGNTIIKPQGIDHSKLVPLLTAAIQELSSKNDALEARLDALEAE